MLLSYLLAQFPAGHWLEYLESKLSTLLGYMGKMLGRFPAHISNCVICVHSNTPPKTSRPALPILSALDGDSSPNLMETVPTNCNCLSFT